MSSNSKARFIEPDELQYGDRYRTIDNGMVSDELHHVGGAIPGSILVAVEKIGAES